MKRNTPLFRLALSLAAIWMAAATAYGLQGSTFYFYTYQQGMASIEASCAHLAEDERMACVGAKTIVGRGPFWQGNPAWQIFKFLLLPPIFLLGLIWFSPEIGGASRRLATGYAGWIRGKKQPPAD